MDLILTQGEQVVVKLADTDGEITVSYGGMKGGKDNLIVHADMPDTSGREGIIYHEAFGANMPPRDPIGLLGPLFSEPFAPATKNEQMTEIFSPGPKRPTIALRAPTPEQQEALSRAIKAGALHRDPMTLVPEYDYKDHAKGLHTLLQNVYHSVAGTEGATGIRQRIRKGLEHNRTRLFDAAFPEQETNAPDFKAIAEELYDALAKAEHAINHSADSRFADAGIDCARVLKRHHGSVKEK